MGLFNRVWSGLDFWDEEENRGQRENFARTRSAPKATPPAQTRPAVDMSGSGPKAPAYRNERSSKLAEAYRSGKISQAAFTAALQSTTDPIANQWQDNLPNTPLKKAGDIASSAKAGGKAVGKSFWETGDTVKNVGQLYTAAATRNGTAARNASQNLDQSLSESILGGVQRGSQSLINAAATPYANRLRGREEKRAGDYQKGIQTTLNSYGVDPRRSKFFAEQIGPDGNAAGRDMSVDLLSRAGLTPDDSAAKSYLKTYARIGEGAFDVATLGTTGAILKNPTTKLTQNINKYARAGLEGGAGNTLYAAQQDNFSKGEALKAFTQGFGMSAGFGVTTNLVSKGARQAPSVARELPGKLENPAVRELDANYQALNQRWQTAPARQRAQIERAIEVNRLERQRISEGGYVSPNTRLARSADEAPRLDPVAPRADDITMRDTDGSISSAPSVSPKGFIMSETKPRAGMKDTIRVTTDENGYLKQTVQTEPDLPLKALDRPDVTARLEEFGPQRPIKGDVDEITKPAPKLKEFDKENKKILTDRLTLREGGKAKAETNAVAVKRALPEMGRGESLKLIEAIENGDFSQVGGRVRQILDAKHKELTDARIDVGYLKDYFPHQWQNAPEVARKYEALKMRAGFQNERTLPTVQEGINLGFKLRNADYRDALGEYLRTADRLLEDRKFMDELTKDGLVVEGVQGQGMGGLVQVAAPGMPNPRPYTDPMTGMTIQGAYYTTPKTAKILNRVFGDQEPLGFSEKGLDTTAKASSLMQDIGMSGGVPFTPVNAFTFAQATKEVLSGNLKSPVVAGWRSLTKENFNKYMDKNLDVVQKMEGDGIPVRSGYTLKDTKKFADQLAEATGAPDKVKTAVSAAWQKAFNEPTFKRFVPTLQVEMYRKVYKKYAKKRGDVEARRIAAQTVKNFYGVTDAGKVVKRNRMGTDFTTTMFFAPKYREAMVNFWIKNTKSLSPTNWAKPEYRQNIRFMAGALVSAYTMNELNKESTGVNMWENPDGKKDKALTFEVGGKQVGIPYLSSIATVPRYAASAGYHGVKGLLGDDSARSQTIKDLSGFLSYGSRPLIDAFATNEDYFGDKIVEDGQSGTDALKQRLGYLVGAYQHPYIREGVRTAQGKNKSIFETVSRASESPLRFYDPRYYKYDGEFNPKGKKDDYSIAQQRERAAIKKQIKSIPNEVGLTDKEKLAYEALNKVEFNDDGTLKYDNDPFYRAKRATALQDDGVFEAMKRKAELNSKLNGQPIDPIYDLAPSERRKILWKQTLPAGTKDPTIDKLYEEEWYQDYRAAQDVYFKEKDEFNKAMGYKDNRPADTNPYPERSKALQSKLDFYYTLPKGTGQRSAMLRANPDILAYWDSVEAWTNGERSQLGLGPVEDKDSQYASGRSGGRGGGRKGSKTFDPYKFVKKTSSLNDELRAIVEAAGKPSKAFPKAKKTKNYS